MSFEERVNTFNNLVQASFRNAMDTVEKIHQTSAEMPLDVLKEIGYPEERTEAIKESHRQVLRILYGGICSANEDLGKLVVMQSGELSRFVTQMASMGFRATQAAKPPAAGKTRTKKKTARKKAAKKIKPAAKRD